MTQDSVTYERMYKWFAWKHLEDRNARIISASFEDLARIIINKLEPGPERTVALRKLLEAKDAAVRAMIRPGG